MERVVDEWAEDKFMDQMYKPLPMLKKKLEDSSHIKRVEWWKKCLKNFLLEVNRVSLSVEEAENSFKRRNSVPLCMDRVFVSFPSFPCFLFLVFNLFSSFQD